VRRDLKLRYKRSVLGVAWSILNPLAYLLVLQFVFGRLMALGIENYTPFLFTGLLVWGWFSSSLIWATSAVPDHRDLIQQPGFPAMVLVPVRITSDLLHFLIALPILFAFLAAGGIRFTPAIALLPALIALQYALMIGPAYALAALHSRFRDTQYLLGIAMHLLFFLTPIFYDAATLPERYRPLLGLNPLARLIAAYRAVLIDGVVPDWSMVALPAAVAALLLPVGLIVFARSRHRFPEDV
jgi:lipopolysaccharide transport system permease protein